MTGVEIALTPVVLIIILGLCVFAILHIEEWWRSR